MNSITTNKKSKKSFSVKWWAVVLWIALWQILSLMLKQEILLVSPISVFREMASLLQTADFWGRIAYSWLRIIGGFLLSSSLGLLLAVLAYHRPAVRDLLAPFILTVKAVPVASFIILLLIWISSENLAVCISFLMVMPIIYTNVLQGMEEADRDLLEMAQVFRLSPYKVLRYIYVPQIFPYFRAACTVGLGLAWKSGIAGEVIGIPSGSIGEVLYQAKIYLDTPSLFAWTLTIILISLLFEKLFLHLIDTLLKCLERMGPPHGIHRH